MSVFEQIAAQATAHLPAPPPEVETPEQRDERREASRRGAEKLASELGLSGPAELVELAGIAGWDAARFKRETEVMGMPIRFREAVAQGMRERCWREETGMMALLLQNGPLALAGLPLETLAGFVRENVLAGTARGYDPFRHGGRLVLGPTGIGKSVTGAAVIRRMLGMLPEHYGLRGRRMERPKWRELAYIRAFDLPNARLALALGKGEADLVEKAKRAEFLVLDDVGWESRRAGADDVVAEVIAARCDVGLPTYATTGLRLAQFEERYGNAVVRRIVESGGLSGRVIDCWRAS